MSTFLKVKVNLPSPKRGSQESSYVQTNKSTMKELPKEEKKSTSEEKKNSVTTMDAVEESILQIETVDGRFSILRPVRSNASLCQITLTRDPKDILQWILGVSLADSEDVVAFDTETTGTQVFGNKDFRMVSFGLCHQESAISLDTRDMTRSEIAEFLRDFRNLTYQQEIPLVAHNLFFDGSVVAYYLGSVRGDKSGAPGWMNYKFCTYALFRYLSSEGFMGQSHSLKFAMTELLGWKDTNEKEQHDWLINNGHVKGTRGLCETDTAEIVEAKLAMLQTKLAEGKQYKPDKGKMYKVPHDILGKYNALDCYATYELYRKVLLPAMRKYTTDFFTFWHSGPMLMSIRNAVDNYQVGIFVDSDILYEFKTKFSKKLRSKIFRRFSKDGWRGKHCYRKIYMKIAMEKYKRFCEEKKPKILVKARGPEPTEPKKLVDKYGCPTKAALNYKRKHKAWLNKPETLSKDYARFLGRKKILMSLIKEGTIAAHLSDKHWARKYLFNPASTADKISFLYEDLEYEIIPSKFKDRPGRLRLRNGVEVDMSESGCLPTGKAAITGIRGRGHILNKFNREIKKLQFVTSCYDKVMASDDGLLHMGYKVPGTNTQRLSGGGGLNLQNLVKSFEFLRAWRCRDIDNYLLCQIDITALEPHVLTELSRCKAMMKLYGPDAKPNDLYIFNAAGIGGILGDPFLQLGYDPENPTKEIISKCKKQYKDLRNVSKSASLCIAEGTLISVRGKGLLPIEQITETDMVWDGKYWVKTSGALHQGLKRVINMEGVLMTPDHKILTNTGWESADVCCKKRSGEFSRPSKANTRWADVWAMASYILRNKIRKWIQIFDR